MVETSSPVAIFDLDYTLLEDDSEAMWGRFLFEKKVVNKDFLQRINEFYQLYEEGKLNIFEYEAFLLKPLTELPLQELFLLRKHYLPVVRKTVRKSMLRNVRRFRSLGFTLIMITAANSFIAEPIAEMLGFPNLICTQVKRDGEKFTNQIEGIPAFREGKVHLLEKWLLDHGLSFSGSWGYSDSHNDLPFLERVEHPVAVAPDLLLYDYARKFGWKIIGI